MPVSEQEALAITAPPVKRFTPTPILAAAAASFAVLVAATALRHEPWTDEAQSWLLARDSSLANLWIHLLHYEGTTGLWQTLLHFLIAVGLPYRGINLVSAALAFGAACLLLWRSPFPVALRVALPFTFFLAYQYGVIARSYDLLPLLLFAAVVAYLHKPILTVLLCLMAAVSIHGMVLAAALALTHPARKYLLLAVSPVILLLAAAAFPASDAAFIAGINYSPGHFLVVAARGFANAFTGEWITSLAVVGLSLPLLWKGRAFWFFLLSAVLLCGVDAAVYSQVWHFGILFLAWLTAVWIASLRTSPDRLALAGLAIMVAIQCYWTGCAITYDWNHAYSASQSAAKNLAQSGIVHKKLYAIGYATTAIQPYFDRNIFANVNDGRPEAYWDWSKRNHVNQDAEHLSQTRPDYVIVGYKNEFERGIWTELVRQGGYRQVQHFEGNTFWQTRVFEPESYDLFARGGQ